MSESAVLGLRPVIITDLCLVCCWWEQQIGNEWGKNGDFFSGVALEYGCKYMVLF